MAKLTTGRSYVDTGKEMPPINPPGPLRVIHADCGCVEDGLIAEYGKRLEPVTAPLSTRKPAMNFNVYSALPV